MRQSVEDYDSVIESMMARYYAHQLDRVTIFCMLAEIERSTRRQEASSKRQTTRRIRVSRAKARAPSLQSLHDSVN